MRRVAYLSTDDLGDFFVYDELTFAPLAERGVEVVTIPWRESGVDWKQFEVVVLRSTWDYQSAAAEFLSALERIAATGTRVINDIEIVRWNLDKRYLRELDDRGVRIVPTWFTRGLDLTGLQQAYTVFDTEVIVIKPAISANADDTFRLPRGEGQRQRQALAALGGRPALVQPYLEAIAREGEYSLFYFDGGYSHAILKTPRPGDFRVQEEHGGSLRAVEPTSGLRRRGELAMRAIGAPTLYARADFVRVGDGDEDFALMELELIEPSLYFPLDPGSPARFAEALVRWLDAPPPWPPRGR